MTGAAPITLLPNAAGTGLAPSEDEIKLLERAFPLVSSRDGDVEALARAAGVAVSVAQSAMNDPATAARLLAAQDKAEDDGRLLKPVAARLTLTMLQKLEAAAGELDVDDIANLLPKVHKVVEHADRMDAAKGDGYGNLAVFHIHFGPGGCITASTGSAALDVVHEVFDLDAAAPSLAMSEATCINAEIVDQDEDEVGA